MPGFATEWHLFPHLVFGDIGTSIPSIRIIPDAVDGPLIGQGKDIPTDVETATANIATFAQDQTVGNALVDRAAASRDQRQPALFAFRKVDAVCWYRRAIVGNRTGQFVRHRDPYSSGLAAAGANSQNGQQAKHHRSPHSFSPSEFEFTLSLR
jgi:hypothetical protein